MIMLYYVYTKSTCNLKDEEHLNCQELILFFYFHAVPEVLPKDQEIKEDVGTLMVCAKLINAVEAPFSVEYTTIDNDATGPILCIQIVKMHDYNNDYYVVFQMKIITILHSHNYYIFVIIITF